MSEIVTEVVEIEDVRPHGNADRLCLARIKGWQTVIRKLDDGSPQFKAGDKAVYIQPDSTLPTDVAERLGVLQYLHEKTNKDGGKSNVVGRVRLRGEPSFGFVVQPEDPSWEVGLDVREHYGIEKFEPPVKFSGSDARPEHPLFHRYTSIENLRNYPRIIHDGEQVIVTEKLHGTNSRVGLVEGEVMAGSHRLRRDRPSDEDLASNLYWFPTTLGSVADLLKRLGSKYRSVVLYGEIYGRRVQKLHYGYGKRDGLGYAAFDLWADGRFLDHEEFVDVCEVFGVPTVPILHLGGFSMQEVVELSRGNTTLPGGGHIREGVVVKPTMERQDPKIGRVILKYLSDDYLLNDKLTASDATDE